jgi:hypothetical protein
MPCTLRPSGQAAVEREIRAQSGDFLLAIAQVLLQLAVGRTRDLFAALGHGDLLEQVVAFLDGFCEHRLVSDRAKALQQEKNR